MNYESGLPVSTSYAEVDASDLTNELNHQLLSVASVPDCARVLDIGCGAGSLLQILLRPGHSVAEAWGFDPDSGALKLASSKLGNRARLICAGVNDIPRRFEPASLDYIFAANVVHLFPEVKASMRHIANALTTGGGIAMCTSYYAEAEVTPMKSIYTQFMLEIQRLLRSRSLQSTRSRGERPTAVRRELTLEHFTSAISETGMRILRCNEIPVEVPVRFITDLAVTPVFIRGLLPGVDFDTARALMLEALDRMESRIKGPIIRNWLFVTARKDA